METWFIVLGVVNIILFIVGLAVFLPKKVYKTNIRELYHGFKKHLPFLLLIFGVVVFHLLEVNIIDPLVTEAIGTDFTPFIESFEDKAVYWFSQNWTPLLVYFFVIMYIAVYPFVLWFSPFYFLVTNQKKSMKHLAYGLVLIYAVALPFYLFLPITNVYRYYGVNSALEAVVPTVERFFYATTTQNNCLPSLHTAIMILIAWSVYLTGNKKFSYFTYFVMVSVILSVIYLAIHWITDVLCGMLLAVFVIFLLQWFIKEETRDG